MKPTNKTHRCTCRVETLKEHGEWLAWGKFIRDGKYHPSLAGSPSCEDPTLRFEGTQRGTHKDD